MLISSSLLLPLLAASAAAKATTTTTTTRASEDFSITRTVTQKTTEWLDRAPTPTSSWPNPDPTPGNDLTNPARPATPSSTSSVDTWPNYVNDLHPALPINGYCDEGPNTCSTYHKGKILHIPCGNMTMEDCRVKGNGRFKGACKEDVAPCHIFNIDYIAGITDNATMPDREAHCNLDCYISPDMSKFYDGAVDKVTLEAFSQPKRAFTLSYEGVVNKVTWGPFTQSKTTLTLGHDTRDPHTRKPTSSRPRPTGSTIWY